MLANDGKDIVRANDSLENVFEKYKDEDGFLYILYTQEDIYGWVNKLPTKFKLFDKQNNLTCNYTKKQ